MINYQNLTNSRTNVTYNTDQLVKDGYILNFDLDYENPDLQEVVGICVRNDLAYKIVDIGGRKTHIWIKGWTKN